MTMETNLVGRVRNTSLPKTNGLLPLYEAVSNSIHAIEEAELEAEEGWVTVEIFRDKQASIPVTGDKKKPGPEPMSEIVGFKIADNGVGFNKANMSSFQTLDSDYKAGSGGRGVGRLLWLKAFDRATVDSTFLAEDGAGMRRTFSFRLPDGVHREAVSENATSETGTSIHLDGFGDRYREASPKTARPIAVHLLEHCLWYFVREGSAPRITILDGQDSISLDDLYDEHMVSSAAPETVTIKGVPFDLTHMRLRAHAGRSHRVAFCAANRVAQEESLKGKVPGLFGHLTDEEGDFVYECYVSSPFLDESVRSDRTSFDIDEEPLELFADTDISFTDIRSAVLSAAEAQLSKYLEVSLRQGRERVDDFVAKRGPRYRPILGRIPKEDLSVDPSISDKELELFLHGHLADLESQILADGHDLMHPEVDDDEEEYREKLSEYLDRVDEIKKSDLAAYVAHRKVIIDLLTKAIQRKDDGKYSREQVIHQLIMPMRSDSNELKPGAKNLWLIDERLAFHDYLASDKTLSAMPITGSKETKEPDLCGLRVFDNPHLVTEGERPPFASLTIVELKRPMRNDAKEGEDKDPIEQCLGYLQRIRDGEVTTPEGRPLRGSGIPGFCYVICDLTPTMEARCKMHDFWPTLDGLGYFGFKREYQAFVKVISFDQLANAAKERNRAFFDKLGLPTT